MIKALASIICLSLVSACALPKPRTVADPVSIYREGLQEGKRDLIERVERDLGQKGAYGHSQPYHPIRLPADIRRVWVVDHPNQAGDLVQGHWTFIVVRPERWAAPSLPLLERYTDATAERIPLNIPVIEEGGPTPASPVQGGR